MSAALDSAPASPRPRIVVGVTTKWRWRTPADAALLALCSRRLRASIGGWLAGAAGLGVALVGAMLVAGLEGPAQRGEAVVRATGWAMWAAAGPLGLSLASDHAGRDQRDGVQQLVMSRGLSRRRLALARDVAGVSEIGWRVALTGALMCAVVVAVGGTLRIAWLLPGLVVFAASGAVAIGGLARLSAHLAGRRGRWLLVALVVAPWVVAELWSAPWVSLPGALERWLWLLADAGLRVQVTG